MDSRYRFENTDVNIDGSAALRTAPKRFTRIIERNRRKQATCSNWNPISGEVFENIRSDFTKNSVIPA